MASYYTFSLNNLLLIHKRILIGLILVCKLIPMQVLSATTVDNQTQFKKNYSSLNSNTSTKQHFTFSENQTTLDEKLFIDKHTLTEVFNTTTYPVRPEKPVLLKTSTEIPFLHNKTQTSSDIYSQTENSSEHISNTKYSLRKELHASSDPNNQNRAKDTKEKTFANSQAYQPERKGSDSQLSQLEDSQMSHRSRREVNNNLVISGKENTTKEKVHLLVLLPSDKTRAFNIHRVLPAITLAIDKVQKKGLLPGHNLTTEYGDSRCHIALAMNEAIKFYIKGQSVLFYFLVQGCEIWLKVG